MPGLNKTIATRGSMADDGDAPSASDLCRQAKEFWARAQPGAALDAAWRALAREPADRASKRLVVWLLDRNPTELAAERRAAYLALLTDPDVEPDHVCAAGWHLVLRELPAADAGDAALDALARRLQEDVLVLTLLREAPVAVATAERLLTRLRRWLLLSGRWRDRPALTAALRAQASVNEGAWAVDALEQAQLENADNAAIAAAYPAVRRAPNQPNAADTVTRAVAAQYEAWPYPSWTRISRREPTRLPDMVARFDAETAAALPVAARILVAGCGTGREAAAVAQAYPDATVMAIDVSEASLDYGRRRCDEIGIAGVRFLKWDLHDVAALNQKFDAVFCSGVLHHLPDPERGLRILAGVLTPGGVMSIMVYSQAARLSVAGARKLVADLLDEPMSDDLLRRVRARLLQSEHPLAQRLVRMHDFATLAGTHDLLLHRHEDPFTIPRLQRALADAGLRLLTFLLSSPPVEARYDAMFPGDPRHRDFASLARFELGERGVRFIGNYRFWCARSPSAA